MRLPVLSSRLTAVLPWLLVACDHPPDVHVHLTSAEPGPHEYAVWRLYGTRRLLARCQRVAQYVGSRAVTPTELPAECVLEPRVPLSATPWLTLRADQYSPKYTSNFPRASLYVLVRLEERSHRRIDLHFPLPPRRPPGVPFGSQGGAATECLLPEVCGARCRLPTLQERVELARPRGPSPPPPPGPSDFDEGDDLAYSPEEPVLLPPCAVLCEAPQEEAAGSCRPTSAEPSPEAGPERGPEAGLDAAPEVGLDASRPPLFDARGAFEDWYWDPDGYR